MKNLLAVSIFCIVLFGATFSALQSNIKCISNSTNLASLAFIKKANAECMWCDCEDGVDVEGKGYSWTFDWCTCSDGSTAARDFCWYCGAGCEVSLQQFCSDVCP